MDKYIEICGTPIEVKSIKDYRIIKVEYIFRPVFREELSDSTFYPVEYIFEKMEPYAAIVEEKIVGGLRQKVKKFECVNAAGRKMILSLDEIPVLVHLADGHAAEIYNDNENYEMMSMDRSANIEFIEALVIQAKEKHIFYGNNIHLFSVLDAYAKVKNAVNELNQKKTKKEQKEEEKAVKRNDAPEDKVKEDKTGVGDYAKNIFGKVKSVVGVGKETSGAENNKNSEPEVSVSTGDKTGDEIREIKRKYSNEEITIEEFNKLINEIIDKL